MHHAVAYGTRAALEVAFLSGHKAAALRGVSCSRQLPEEERTSVQEMIVSVYQRMKGVNSTIQ
jgi:hypothetical protein